MEEINKSDTIAYFEMARLAMVYVSRNVMIDMDISDEEFVRLRDQLDKYMNVYE